MSNSNNNNRRVPKLRFPEFTGEWEEKKMREVVTSFSGGTPKSGDSRYYGGTIPFIRSGEIHGEKTVLSITEEGLNNSSAKLVKKGDLLIALYGATSGEVAISKIDGAINQAILCIQSKKIDSFFLCNYIERNKDYITSRYLQGGQGNLSSDIIMTFQVRFPTPAEQQKIAECLTEMDNLISAQAQKVALLKTHKKGLMQQLYPQPGETTPQLRFPGFTGEWEEKKLGEVFITLINSTLSRADLNSITGKAMYVHYGDVLIIFGDVLDLRKVQLPFISDDLLAEKACRSTLRDGDVIIADTAEDKTVGKCTEIKNIGILPVVSGLHTIPLRPSIKFAVGFLGYYFNSQSYRNGLYPLMQGVKVTSISRTALMGTKIQYPLSLAEQQKIAECLSELDKNIEAESAKLEALKAHKKGLMQQLFPEPIK